MREDILLEAALWQHEIDADSVDWDGFTQWLERSGAHRQAYAIVAAALWQRRDDATPLPRDTQASEGDAHCACPFGQDLTRNSV